MSALATLKHLMIPHESNNHRAKVLHSTSLTILAVFLVLFQFVLNAIPKTFPDVLGYAANISPSEVVRLTNVQRKANGLTALGTNKTLNAAALAKGQDMLSKGYWSHFGPDGTTPWSFLSKFGYSYRYAGENLARDFTNADTAVSAWMNSPTHKENILSPKYKEIGIGVVEGKLNGVETTIIVQFFGAKTASAPVITDVSAREISTVSAAATAEASIKTEDVAKPFTETVTVDSEKISPFSSTKNLSLGIVGFLLLVLSIDLVIIRGGRVSRIGGRTLAHIAYFGMILAVILILKSGQIL